MTLTMTDVVMQESRRILVREGVPHLRVTVHPDALAFSGMRAVVACGECGKVEALDLPHPHELVVMPTGVVGAVVRHLEEAIARHLHKPAKPGPTVLEAAARALVEAEGELLAVQTRVNAAREALLNAVRQG